MLAVICASEVASEVAWEIREENQKPHFQFQYEQDPQTLNL